MLRLQRLKTTLFQPRMMIALYLIAFRDEPTQLVINANFEASNDSRCVRSSSSPPLMCVVKFLFPGVSFSGVKLVMVIVGLMACQKMCLLRVDGCFRQAQTFWPMLPSGGYS